MFDFQVMAESNVNVEVFQFYFGDNAYNYNLSEIIRINYIIESFITRLK